MNFEYDENKSQFNKAKHGIDFEEAQKLFFDCVGAVVSNTIYRRRTTLCYWIN
jgi:uncharacterized DUF497 family protein